MMAADKPTQDPLSKLYAEWVSAAMKLSVAGFDASAKIMEASMQSITAARAKSYAAEKAATQKADVPRQPVTDAAKPKDASAEQAPKIAATKPTAKAAPGERQKKVESFVTTKPSSKTDDLKSISGIGPKLEQMLQKRGITSFAQVAALKAADIAKLDEEMGLNGRIQRDDWMGQAAKLAG